MARLKTLSKNEWQKIAKKHSAKTPRYSFQEVNSKAEFTLKRVIRGWFTMGDGSDQLTTTGFLENETGKVIAGVDSIPTEAKDTE